MIKITISDLDSNNYISEKKYTEVYGSRLDRIFGLSMFGFKTNNENKIFIENCVFFVLIQDLFIFYLIINFIEINIFLYFFISEVILNLLFLYILWVYFKKFQIKLYQSKDLTILKFSLKDLLDKVNFSFFLEVLKSLFFIAFLTLYYLENEIGIILLFSLIFTVNLLVYIIFIDLFVKQKKIFVLNNYLLFEEYENFIYVFFFAIIEILIIFFLFYFL